MKAVAHFFKKLYLDGRILLHHGTVNPARVKLSESEQYVSINPKDWRARKKIIADTLRGRYPRNQRFWRLGVEVFRPDTVLDVGVNYGECLFSTVYPKDVQVYGFEPNPTIQPYLQQSRADHPNREQIHLHFVLASDGSHDAVDFFVDEFWSGSSTAAGGHKTQKKPGCKTITVTATSVDKVIKKRLPNCRRLFFKIDVEGYEYRVLAGMAAAVSGVDDVLGMIEFNPNHLQDAGEDVKAFWAYLNKTFAVYVFDKQDTLHEVSGCSMQDLYTICGPNVHTDLVLIKSNSVVLENEVSSAWSRSYHFPQRAAA